MDEQIIYRIGTKEFRQMAINAFNELDTLKKVIASTTATADDIVTDKTAYTASGLVTGTLVVNGE